MEPGLWLIFGGTLQMSFSEDDGLPYPLGGTEEVENVTDLLNIYVKICMGKRLSFQVACIPCPVFWLREMDSK